MLLLGYLYILILFLLVTLDGPSFLYLTVLSIAPSLVLVEIPSAGIAIASLSYREGVILMLVRSDWVMTAY